MSILSLKRWEPSTYEADTGVFIRMKLKRLKRHEAKPLTKVLVSVFERAESAKGAEITAAQKAAILSTVYEVIPEDQLKSWFAECVKDIEDFTVDDVPVTTGPELLDNADDGLLFWILFRLQQLSKLSSSESKGSGSPALSPATSTPDSSVSDVKPTEREAGPQA
jgi:hypothetical protein